MIYAFYGLATSIEVVCGPDTASNCRSHTASRVTPIPGNTTHWGGESPSPHYMAATADGVKNV